MRRRLTIVLLITATLATSLAWAWDNHPGLLGDGQAGVVPLAATAAGGSPTGDDGAPIEHHCCHGYAHLLALVFEAPTPALPVSAPEPQAPRITLISHHPEVGTKPPRS